MAGQPVPVPTTKNTEDIILCVEDIKKIALKKLSKGVAGESFMLSCVSSVVKLYHIYFTLHLENYLMWQK